MNDKGKKTLEAEIEFLKRRIAELEETEDRLQHSEHLFHALFEQAGGYSMILDPNTDDGIPIIIDANRAACELHGYSKEDFIGRPVDIVDDQEGKQLVREHTRMIMTGEPFYIENRHEKRDGGFFHAAVNAQRIDIGNEPPIILSTEYDITEQKNSRLALQESEERFRTAILNMPLPIIIYAEDGEILQINNEWIILTGYTINEIPGLDAWTALAYGSDSQKMSQYIQSLFDKGVGHDNGEFSITRKDGRKLRWHFFSSPLGSLSDGRRIRMSAAVDVTDQRLAEQEIRTLSRFPSENPNPVLRFDLQGNLLYANNHGRRLFEELADTDLAEQIKVKMRIKSRQELQVGDRWYLLQFTPIESEGYINVYGTDITETKELQQMVTHTEKMKAIGQLAGGIAHDFNNQLGAIFGYLDLLQLRLSEGTEEFGMVSQMQQIAEQAKSLTSQLLSFSRKGKMLHEPIDVHRIISDVAVILERSIDRRISIELELEDFAQTIMGDPSQIHNALLNIALNSRDAMPEGGLIRFTAVCRDIDRDDPEQQRLELREDRYIILGIEDNGTGMDKEVLEQALEPFFTTKEEGRGTGMGLSAAYGAMIAHEGRLSISSESGKGTLIKLYFPAHASRTVPVPERVGPVISETGEGLVLIVDDHEDLCITASQMLQLMGYEVRWFLSPTEALSYYAVHAQQLRFVILDMIMPEMDGSELYSRFKEIREDIPVILSSGYSATGEVQTLLDKGVRAFLHKPWSMQELSRTIELIITD